jgi:hypothetical protein
MRMQAVNFVKTANPRTIALVHSPSSDPPTRDKNEALSVMVALRAAVDRPLADNQPRQDAISPQWFSSVLSCRPLPKSGSSHPGPSIFCQKMLSDWSKGWRQIQESE